MSAERGVARQTESQVTDLGWDTSKGLDFGTRVAVRRGRAERRLQRDSKAEFGGTTAWARRISAPAAQFRWRKVVLARCGDVPIFR